MAKVKKDQTTDEVVEQKQAQAQEQPQETLKGKVFIVHQKFVINNNFSKVYQPGEIVSGVSEEKLKQLIEKGLVKSNDE